jgi:hypothetical protein
VHGGAAGVLEGLAQRASVMRGSAITLRRPAASTPPSTELSASLLTTSAAGRLAARDAEHLVEQRGGATRGRRW